MQLIIILLPIILFIVVVNEVKYRLKIRREAIHYVDLQRKIEQIEAKETELIQREREKNVEREERKRTVENEEREITLTSREKILICIATAFLLILIIYFQLM